MTDYLQHTRESFNKIAPAFDETDRANPILLWMRGIVHKIYLKDIKQGETVLELNCGTGIDAMFLARRGIKVYATDISDEMIHLLTLKASHEIEKGSIIAEVCAFSDIGKIKGSGFDAVVSNFGGLNCINEFNQLSNDLYDKLKPDGKFIAVVMNKLCPWEILYFILKLDFRKAFRRFKKEGIDGAVDDQTVKTFYFFPKEFGKKFCDHFRIEKIYTHALYTPPPYLLGIYKRIKPIVKVWMKIDEVVKGIYPFNRVGDHFIIVMKRK